MAWMVLEEPLLRVGGLVAEAMDAVASTMLSSATWTFLTVPRSVSTSMSRLSPGWSSGTATASASHYVRIAAGTTSATGTATAAGTGC
eukprot:4773169-Pyramimonas_sp.AAC.1